MAARTPSIHVFLGRPTLALYVIKSLVFITVVESVHSAVRTDSLYKANPQSVWFLNG
jgi:hypothetical protein